MSLITKGEALRRRNHRIADVNPEDTVAWEAGDNKVARRNLLCTAAGDHVAFSIWSLWSVLAPVMPASYLLAGGLFQERLRGCGADLVTPPLGTHRGLAHVIANRFRNAALVAGASRLDLCSLPGDPDNMAGNQEPSRGILDDVAKMLRLPFSTPEFIDRIFTGSVNQVGRRTLYVLITTWDAASGGPFAASAIASTGMAKTAEIVQSMFIGPVFNPLLKMLGADKVAIRASLCASQLVGLGIMRYGVRSEPMHSMTVEQLVDAIGPTMQRYLVGDISRG